MDGKGDTLGTHRTVASIPVCRMFSGDDASKGFTFSVGGRIEIPQSIDARAGYGGDAATLRTIARGTVVALCTTSDGDTIAIDVSSVTEVTFDRLIAPVSGVTFGVVAEAVVDKQRRRTRPGQKPTCFYLPMTFEGVDVVTAPPPHGEHQAPVYDAVAFFPGDAVYIRHRNKVAGIGTGNLRGYALCRAGIAPFDKAMQFIGIAHVASAGGTGGSVQCRVDTLNP